MRRETAFEPVRASRVIIAAFRRDDSYDVTVLPSVSLLSLRLSLFSFISLSATGRIVVRSIAKFSLPDCARKCRKSRNRANIVLSCVFFILDTTQKFSPFFSVNYLFIGGIKQVYICTCRVLAIYLASSRARAFHRAPRALGAFFSCLREILREVLRASECGGASKCPFRISVSPEEDREIWPS